MKRLILLLFIASCASSIEAQSISTNSLNITVPQCAAAAFQNVPYSCQVAPTGGVPPYNFTLTSGGGSGLSISTGSGGGLINGTPTGTSQVTFNLSVSDSGNSSQAATISVTPGALSTIAVTPTNTTVKTSNTLQLVATGTFSNGTTDLSSLAAWACTGTCGSVSASGLFTAGGSGGTATIKATFNSITDDGGAGIAVVVTGSSPPFFVTPVFPTGQIYQNYPLSPPAVQLACTGGTPPYTFALGTLVPQNGISLTSAGVVSGLPTASGTNSGTLTCTDSLSNVGTSPSVSLVVASVSSLAVTFSPASPITAAGTTQATAIATYSSGPNAVVPNNFVTWTSSNTACATVSAAGLVTALNVSATCTSSIQAAIGATNGSTTLTVNPVSSASATLLQYAPNDACASGSTTCNVTFNQTTTAGTALIAYINNVAAATTMSSFTDGGDTFSSCTTLGGTTCVPAGGIGGVDIRAIMSGAGGKTSGTCTVSSAPSSAWSCGILEFQTNSPTGFTFDASGNIVNAASSTTYSGVGLTLSGSNDVIVQIDNTNSHVTQITSSYTLNKDGFGNAEPYVLNTTTGSAPTITIAVAGKSVLGAIAIKQTGSGGGSGVTAPTCLLADVQATVNNLPNGGGQTMFIPGTCTINWANFVTIPATKGVTVQPSPGTTVTISSTSEGFAITQGNFTTRVSGFTCNRASNIPTDYNGHCVQVSGSTSSATARIDHWTMCGGGGACTAQAIFISLSGNGPVLIDHNTMTGGSASVLVQNFGMGSGNTTGWTDNIVPGGPNFAFFEDNTAVQGNCLSNCNWGSSSLIQAYYGARNVIRHNTLQMMNIDEHGSGGGGNECTPSGSACPGAVGTRWWEIYSNNFKVVPGGNWFSYMDLRAGTGVVFNNSVTGTNLGSGRMQVYEENTCVWPNSYQIGAGISGFSSTCSPEYTACASGTLNTAPAYFWNNPGLNLTTSGTVSSSRDYNNLGSQPATMTWKEQSGDTCSTTYSYVPFVYPHPLSTP